MLLLSLIQTLGLSPARPLGTGAADSGGSTSAPMYRARISLRIVPLMISSNEDNKEHCCSALHLQSVLLILTN